MIPRSVHIAMLMSLLLLLAAQMLFLPLPLILIFALIWLCLLYSMWADKPPVKKVWAFALTLAALASIYFSYQTFLGIEAGVAVLSTFLFAKALESKSRRDVIILFNFALFVSASSFLLSQSFAMAAAVLLCLLSSFTGLYRLQISEFEQGAQDNILSLKQDMAHVGRFLLHALPFFILLFLFFPRLPPLWHIPVPQNKAVTGISDSMSPGDIAQLSQSSALAFRIIGDLQQLPARPELYWRALVLDEYDGARWTSSFSNQRLIQPNEVVQKAHKQLAYQYLAADPRVTWIMALEKSVPLESRYQLGQDWRITPQRQNIKNEPIPLMWIGPADLRMRDERQLQRLALLNTQVIKGRDLKSQQLAKQLLQQSGGNPQLYIQRVLEWYQKHGFAYTLSPGTLGQNRIDEFLFGTRQGFCEHYASSFVMLMRHAGIPARIVTGYQGGQSAPDGRSWEVRQLDAHAWTEVWLNGRWQRYDPTAIVAPHRIDGGMQNYMEDERSVFGGTQSEWSYRQYALLTKMRIWNDYASYQWQSKVVGYNAESQRSWFQKIGLDSVYSGALALAGGIIALLLLYLGWMYWLRLRQISGLQRSLERFNKQLAPQLQKLPAETVPAWLQRLSLQAAPDDRLYFQQLVRLHAQYAYAPKGQSERNMREIKTLLKTCAYALKK